MKKNMMKRLLAGCLAVLLLFSDASSVLASNLSEPSVGGTEITEFSESSEMNESTEVVTGTETSANTEQVESTEEGTSTETTEIVEESEMTESTEEGSELQEEEPTEAEPETETEIESEVVEELMEEPHQVSDIVATSYTGPIYQAYFGIPSVLVPSAGTNQNIAWTGDRIIGLGTDTGKPTDYRCTNTWRILSPDLYSDSTTALLMSDEILLTGNELYAFDSTYDANYPSNINAILATYANSEVSTGEKKFSDIEQSAMKAIRLLTKDEVMNAGYGFYSEISDTQDKTKELNAGNTFCSYLVDSGVDNNQIWVLRNGLIKEYGYLNRWATEGEEETAYQAFLTETYETGYAAAIELDLDKVFMTMYTDIIGRNPQYNISDESNRTWRLLLHSGYDGFTVTVPKEVPYEADIKVDVTALGAGTYHQISMVLADKDGNIVWYDSGRSNDGTTPTTGEFTFTMYPALPTGTYTIKVFAENTAESYVSNVVSSEIEIVSASATNPRTSQAYGEISVTWDLENTNGWYTYCDVYRSDSLDGTYTKVNTEVISCNNSNGYGFYTDIVTPVAGEVANPTYYYKVAVVDYSTGEVLGEMSEPTTNADLYYGIQEHEGYIGAYLVDKDKNKVTSLTLHEGEAMELGVAFVKEDGNIEYLETEDWDGVRWYLHTGYAASQEYDNEEIEVSKDKVGIYPAKMTTTADGYLEIPSYQVYLQAEDGATGTYYLTAEIHQGWQHKRYWQIPVTVAEAEDGVDYGQRPDIEFTTTQAESAQKLRDLMVARDYDGYFIAQDGAELNINTDINDTYAEREGMKPYEGDYLFYQAGERNSVSSMYSEYETFSVSFNGDYYTGYKMTTPFITTAEEEARVNAKINELIHTPGGDLYNAAYGDTTTEQKIKAIYDWIIANVNPNVPGDRRTPIYHTVWHTLFGAYGGYSGSGTCGAFAVLFTRLSREMGIASKVIMGTDSAAHAYNIVELGNKWYFIDTNSRRYLADEDNFTRAQEQYFYLDSRFIANYLSKIPGNDYYVESTGTAVVTGTDGTTSEEYGDLSKAVSYIMEQAAKEGNESVEYTITIKDGDMAFPETAIIFSKHDEDNYPIAHYDDRVTIDLGGNSLIIRDGLGASLAAKKVHNGVISIGDDAVLDLRNNADKTDSVYENLRIIYKSTQGAVDKTPSFKIFAGYENKVILKDSVTLDEFYIVELRNMIEINTDLSVKGGYIQMMDGNTETDDKITINGTLTVDGACRVYAGTFEIEEFISKRETTFSAPAETKLIIGGELSLAGYTGWSYDVGAWGEPGTVEVALKRQFAAAEDTVPYKQATINWSGSIFNYGVDYVTAPMFHFTAQDYVDGVLQENKALPSGTTIGTVTAKGWNRSTGYYNVALNSTNLSQYITVETADDGKAFADIENNVLSVVSLSVTVKGPNSTSQSFSSLKKAVDGLKTVANGASGDYSFIFAEDAILTSNITLPSYVKLAAFTVADGAETHLDFNGKTLTASGMILVDANLRLVNSAETDGKLATTYASATTPAVVMNGYLSDDEFTVPTLVEGVNISATSGIVRFGHLSAGNQRVKATVTAKTVKIVGGYWDIDNIVATNLELCNKFETDTTGDFDVTSVLSSGTIKITNGTLTVEEGATLGAAEVIMSAGTLKNYGELVVDKLTQNATSKTFLYTGSETEINESAVFYTTQLARSEESDVNPVFYRKENATVAFNTSFKRADNDLLLDYAVISLTDVNGDGKYNDVVDFAAQQVVYSTNITTFPMNLINVIQASETPKFAMLLQKGTNIVAANDWIIVKATDDNGVETELQRFTTWKAAMNYINSLNNTSARYVVEFTEDLDLEEAFTMPTKLSAIKFRGVNSENGGRVNLTYTGDLKLTASTSFEKINLSAQKYNSTTKKYDVYKSNLNLNGKNLVFLNSNAEFATVTGTAASTLCIMGTNPTGETCTVTIDKTIRNLGLLELQGTTLNVGGSLKTADAAISGVKDVKLTNADLIVANGSVATTGTLTMTNALLDVNSKINLVNVVSNSDRNRIAYGGNAAGNILTITGTVTSENAGDATFAPIRTNAIDITVKALATTEYTQNALLANAKKVAPAWFVVGSTYDEETEDRTGVASTTYKNGEKIYYGVKENAPVELRVWSAEQGKQLVYGSYATVQEAFAEIDRVADKTVDYYVYLSGDTSSAVIPSTITTPVYAKSVFMYSDASTPKTLYFGQQITMKSSLALQNIVLAPTSATSTISAGDYCLYLENTTVAEGKKLANITGSGVTKNSSVIVKDYSEKFTITGNLTNIGMLQLNNSKLEVNGTVSVGKLQAILNQTSGYNPTLIGTATLTRNSNKVITAVAPLITISGESLGVLEIALQEKKTVDGKVLYEPIDFTTEDMENLLENTGIRLANAKKMPSFIITPSVLNCGNNVAGYRATKAAGYVVLQLQKNIGAKLYYTNNGGFSESYFRTFADAVTEINNQATKRDYVITLFHEMSDISLAKPAALTMPNKSYVNTLTIEGVDASDIVELYHTGNFTLTVPTTFKNVYLEKVVKVGTAYVPIEEQAVENNRLYPAIVTVNTANNKLTIDGKVYFNTPIAFNGGGKGILEVADDGQVVTLTNGKTVPVDVKEQLICGSVTSFAEVIVKADQTLNVSEYGYVSGTNIKFTAGNMTITTLTNAGEAAVIGSNTAGTFKVTNLNLDGGTVYSCGTLIATHMNLNGDVHASAEKGVTLASGTLTVNEGAVANIDTFVTTNGTIKNYGTLVCDKLTQNSGSKTFFYTGCKTVVNENAVFYGTQLARGNQLANPIVCKQEDAKVAFNTMFKAADAEVVLNYAVLAENDADDGIYYDTYTDVTGQQVLFTSNIAKFPVALVETMQASSNPKYTMLLQRGANIIAAIDWITVKAQGVDGEETVLKTFTTWKEAMTYLNTLSNTSMNYIVELSEDVDLEEAFTMSAKTSEIIFRGAGGESGMEPVSLTYTGDLKLATHTRFENINLSAQKYNSTTKTYDVYRSNLNLNGKNLEFVNSNAEFASITGTAASELAISGDGTHKVTVYGAVKNLGSLGVEYAELEVGSTLKATAAAISGVKDVALLDAQITVVNGTTAFTGTLMMQNAVLDTNSKINLVNVESYSDNNHIFYGGNASGNILTITGTVTGPTEDDDIDGAVARVNAIDICAKALNNSEAGYAQGDLLMNAKKASPVWFVVGSEYDVNTGERTSYISETYKNGEKIYFGEKPDGAVELQILDDLTGQALVYGTYVTLDEAFKEIDRIGDKTAEYYVYLTANVNETSIPKTITTPANASAVTVYADEASPKTIYFGQTITMKSALALKDVILAPTLANSMISMGNFGLLLDGTTVADGKKLGSITGSGVAKDSHLVLQGYQEAFTISGNLTNVGMVILDESKLAVEGTVNIGNLNSNSTPEFTSALIGTATLTRKNGVVTAINPLITINGEVHGNLEVALREKVTAADKTVSYEPINFTSAEMENLFDNTGIRLLKAVNVPTFVFVPSEMNGVDRTPSYMMTKSAAYVVLQKSENVGARLHYEMDNGGFQDSHFKTFADAVTEINNLKTKRDYTIYLYDNMADISLEKPAALTMPNKNYVNSLTIVGEGASDVVKLHHTGNITLTAPTTLQGVYLEKVVNVGTAYVAIENHTVENSAKYPAAITLSTGGYALTIDGKAYFNTPVNFNGGGKGTLTVTANGQLATITNGQNAPAENAEQLILGGITNFAEVAVSEGQVFTVSEYGVFANNRISYTAGNFTVTTLNNAGEVAVVGTNKPGTMKLTNANLNGGHLYSCGTLNVTNMTLEGEVQVRAEKDFNITGQLVSFTDMATFYSRQKTVTNFVPYLNITGTVTLGSQENTIRVGVYPAATAENPNQLVKLESAPKATAQLLTAKTATEAMFVPVATNVGGVGAYSATNTQGYILKKTGTAIYAYYGDEVAVALCRGNADTGNLETADVIAYYPTFKDAVTAIDALKDKTAEYTIVLLQDVNIKNTNGVITPAPVGIALPTQAANVIITSREGEVFDIYFTGSISLRANTEFVKVKFNPMTSAKAGAAFNLAAGNFNLTLTDIEVADAAGMKLNNITGSTKQVTTLATDDLLVYGGVSGSKELVIGKPVTVNGAVKATTITLENGTDSEVNEMNVKGTFTADNLVMEGYTTVNGANTLTIKNIYNNVTENISGTQLNTINYGINSSGAPLLRVTGFVYNNNVETVIFNLTSTQAKSDYALAMDASKVKYVLSDKKKLATVEKAALSEITFQLNGEKAFATGAIVKANKGVYVIDTTANAAANRTLLAINQNGVVSETYFLDYAQAVTEINNIADVNADYTIYIGVNGADVTDTNMTDANKVSAITMPGTNKAASVTLTTLGVNPVSLKYNGHIVYAGDLKLEDLVLSPTADSNITVTKDKYSATLYMDNVTTTADKNWTDGNAEAVGFISKITGTNKVTEVEMIDCDLRVKGAVSNVAKLTLNATDLITTNTVTVTDVVVAGASHWDAFGRATVTNLDVAEATGDYYLASRQTATTLLPMFVVNGNVTLNAQGTPAVWKVLKVTSKANDLVELAAEEYDGTALVVTAKEDADKFVAYPYSADRIGTGVGGITTDNLIAYKTTKNEVVNGNKEDMVVRIIRTHEGVAGQEVTYAKSFDEAVTIINNLADTTADYRMELLQGDISSPLKTTKNGTAYGAMTLPTKAKSVTITSGMTGITEDEEGNEKTVVDPAVIFYTGTLKANCNTRFENVALTEGTTKTQSGKVVFTPKYSITPSYAGAFELAFADSVQTVWKEGENPAGLQMKFASVSISKGKLTLEGNEVTVAGAMTVKDLEIDANTHVTVVGKTTITNVMIPRTSVQGTGSANIHSQTAIVITNVTGTGDGLYNGTLFLDNCFTKTTRANQASVTQLAINGTITDASVTILPRIYDFATKSYRMLNAEDAGKLNVTGGKVAANQKIATMPKAATDTIWVVYQDDNGALQRVGGELFKQATALYVTTEDLLVKVIGTNDAGREVYEAEFLTWDQAVSEINKRADKTVTYKMILQGYLGGKYGSEAPLGTITMPTYAKEVIVTSEAGKDYHMMFTGTTLTIRSNTTFENVGLFAVKKVVKNKVTTYQPVNFNISAGNFALNMSNMKKMDSDVYVSQVENLSGGAKGSFTFTQGTGTNTQASPARKITGFGTVDLYNVDMAEVVMDNISQSTYPVYNGISGVTTLNVHPGVTLESNNGVLTVKNLNVAGATVAAKNITVSLVTTLESAKLVAGSTAANDGKMSLKTIVVEDRENYLSAEQDKSGNTQVTITDTVTAAYNGYVGESAIAVDLYYNNYASHAKVHEGMVLLNAQKAAASWFEPFYTVVDFDEDIYIAGMGYETEGYGTYKSGKTIRYGYLGDAEVELVMMKTTNGTSKPAAYTYFKTFEEAVTEINNLALYQPGTKVFENYQINLLENVVEIGNTKGDGRYSALTLPTKASNVVIDGSAMSTMIGFSGNLTVRCNTEFRDVYLVPLKLVGRNVTPTKGNIAIGNYTLVFDNTAMIAPATGETMIGNISGSAAKGVFKVVGTASGEEPYIVEAANVTSLREVNLVDNAILGVTGNVNVYQLRLTANSADTSAQIHANGTFTTSLIYKEGTGEVVLGKGAGKAMTINGAQLDLDGDKKKENYTVFYSHPQEENAGKIKIQISGIDTKIGTKVLTSKYLNAKDYSCVNAYGRTYGTYQSGTNLMLGKKAV